MKLIEGSQFSHYTIWSTWAPPNIFETIWMCSTGCPAGDLVQASAIVAGVVYMLRSGRRCCHGNLAQAAAAARARRGTITGRLVVNNSAHRPSLLASR